MPKITGKCLCGQVSFQANGEIALQANCHCTDCQQNTGGAYATLLFMNDADIEITGETKRFEHPADSDNILTKDFCSNCGSQMFGRNSGRPGIVNIKAGCINEKEHIKPQFNVFASRKLSCTVLDETIPAFDEMPG